MRTERLLLRRWREEDREPFAALNADPQVMEHFVAPLTRAESDAAIDRFEAELASRPYGLWAVEVAASGQLIGFTGLHLAEFAAPFNPSVEVGWRLARSAWGQGFATEAATAAMDHAFDVAGLEEVMSFTAVANLRSRAVMERLGMVHDPADDFEHPAVPAGHRIRHHVLYRITADRWRLGGRSPKAPGTGPAGHPTR